jgi:hypothetical protein
MARPRGNRRLDASARSEERRRSNSGATPRTTLWQERWSMSLGPGLLVNRCRE